MNDFPQWFPGMVSRKGANIAKQSIRVHLCNSWLIISRKERKGAAAQTVAKQLIRESVVNYLSQSRQGANKL